MPRQRRHWLDGLADELSEWIDRESEALIAAFKGGARAPFAAVIDEAQKLDVYRHMMVNKDGSWNEQGKQQVLQRVGIPGFVEVMQALNKEREHPAQPLKPGEREVA
jgi:hypothetical protein